MAIEFTAPDFIKENDAKTIQAKMMQALPADIDNMPAGFPYDFTMPTAMVKAELVQFHLVNTLKLMFPAWAYGEWLDLHAKAAGLRRREAGYASGYLTVKGEPGTRIAKGSIFATTATETAASTEFKTLEVHTIPEFGALQIKVEAVAAGTGSNVNPLTVILMSKPISGITSVSNEDYITGGTEAEEDDSLRQRIEEVNQSNNSSFVGNDADYIRWAKEVTGVGTALVEPEWNGPGTVKIIVLDANGQPANEAITANVYNYIVSPDNRLDRKAPIGALVSVISPGSKLISYECKIVMNPAYTIEVIRDQYQKALKEYYSEAKRDQVIKYSSAMAILTLLPGVDDVTDFTMNGGKSNITILQDEYPETLEIIIDPEV